MSSIKGHQIQIYISLCTHKPWYFLFIAVVKYNTYTITNWRVSLSKICHEWPNNAVTHECAQRMNELQRYLVMSDLFLIMKFANLVIVFII